MGEILKLLGWVWLIMMGWMPLAIGFLVVYLVLLFTWAIWKAPREAAKREADEAARMAKMKVWLASHD
jgi:cbb3-type cytochrome oxidase subunit 3